MQPKLVYDDGCRYCTWAATLVVDRSDVVPVRLSRVRDDAAVSRLTDEERSRLPEGYEACAQLLTDDGVYSCGEAVERGLVLAGLLPAEIVAQLREYAGYIGLREAVYHFTSNHSDQLATVLAEDPPVRAD